MEVEARLQTMACGALGNLAANSPNNQVGSRSKSRKAVYCEEAPQCTCNLVSHSWVESSEATDTGFTAASLKWMLGCKLCKR